MLDAASLMAGVTSMPDEVKNLVADAFEADYRQMYGSSPPHGTDQWERIHQAVNEQVALLESALKRGHLQAIRNSDGAARELILCKADWLEWICQTGRFSRLVSAFQQQGDDGHEDNDEATNGVVDPLDTVPEGPHQDSEMSAAESGSNDRVITIPLHQHGETWSELQLQALVAEHRKGATQAVLAKRYGLTPQRISALLKQAKGQTGGLPGISNPMSGWGGGK